MFNSRRARLEIDLPTGISIVYDAADQSGRLPSRTELMARMRAAIGATDWAAVKALYGEDPLVLGGGGLLPGSPNMQKRSAPVKAPTVPPSSGSAPATDRTVTTSP